MNNNPYYEISYMEAISAYRKWSTITSYHLDLEGFLKFIDHHTLGRKRIGMCLLPMHAIKRIKQINGPHGATIIKMYLIQTELSVEGKTHDDRSVRA